MRIALSTHGCRLNQAETDAMAAQLRAAGHQVVPSVDEAEVFVLNTCTITDRADADVRYEVRRARRRNPAVRVVLTGCYAQSDPTAASRLDGVVGVLGNADKDRLSQALHERPPGWVDVSALRGRAQVAHLPAALPDRRTRALLKVQDGCNYRCSFCIVPAVRGPSRSLPIEAIAAELDALVRGGATEVVLTGIHLGTWGRDLRPRRRLVELVTALLPRLGGARLRLSSLDPHEVDPALIDLMAAERGRICRHLHLPVQSGDPVILRRMHRGHTASDFARLVETLTRRIDGIAIGTDVIVGFPGESESAFERTRALLAGLPVAYHHVFTYSRRKHTKAAALPDQVPRAVKAARNASLRALSEAQALRFAQGFAGQTLDAVVERGEKATTDNYLRLRLPGAAAQLGRRVRVRVSPSGRAATLAEDDR